MLRTLLDARVTATCAASSKLVSDSARISITFIIVMVLPPSACEPVRPRPRRGAGRGWNPVRPALFPLDRVWAEERSMPERTWWKHGVVYQVYPRSFQDCSGDGVGDLEGIRHRLDHLAWLGVNTVWISPIYPSPMADFGYDVADYRDIRSEEHTSELQSRPH